jgi:hypothetical protein
LIRSRLMLVRQCLFRWVNVRSDSFSYNVLVRRRFRSIYVLGLLRGR